MSNDFLTDLDFSGDDKKASTAGYVFGGMKLILLLVSGMATFSFFYEYAGGLLATLFPEFLSHVGAGIIGVVLMELSVIFWLWISVNDAETKKQISLAKNGYFFSLVISVAVTVVYFVLSTSLGSSFIDEQASQTINLIALIIIIAAVAVQFILSSEYSRASAKHKAAGHNAEMRADKATAEQAIQKTAGKARLTRSVQAIQQQIPNASQSQADRAARDFMAQPGNSPNGNKRRKSIFKRHVGFDNPATAHDESDHPT